MKINYTDKFALVKVNTIAKYNPINNLSLINEISKISGVRVNINGCWYIKTSHDNIDESEIINYVKRHYSNIYCNEWIENAELFKGNVNLGIESSTDELSTFLNELVRSMEIKPLNATVSNIVTKLSVEHCEGFVSLVKNNYHVQLTFNLGLYNYVINLKITGNLKTLDDVLKVKIKRFEDFIKSLKYVRSLKPHELGKWKVILSPNAAIPLFNFIKKFIIADITNVKLLNQKIFIKDVDIVDNPINHISSRLQFFDDEMVRTSRKYVIEDGILVSFLSTRSVNKLILRKYSDNITIGNAKGIYEAPQPSPSTIEVLPGNWSLREMVQESKKAIYVEDFEWYFISGNTIYIKPSIVWRIEDGEFKEPILIRVIKLVFPASTLNIESFSKDVMYVTDKHNADDAYVLPYIKTLGGVE